MLNDLSLSQFSTAMLLTFFSFAKIPRQWMSESFWMLSVRCLTQGSISKIYFISPKLRNPKWSDLCNIMIYFWDVTLITFQIRGIQTAKWKWCVYGCRRSSTSNGKEPWRYSCFWNCHHGIGSDGWSFLLRYSSQTKRTTAFENQCAFGTSGRRHPESRRQFAEVLQLNKMTRCRIDQFKMLIGY